MRNSQHHMAKSVQPTDILKQCNPISIGDFGSLERLLAGSSLNLKEFIQTNFAVDGSGVLRLATLPKGTVRNRKRTVRRKRKGTLEMDAAVRKLGQETLTNYAVQKRIPQFPPALPQNQPTTVVQKQISPTIPDYSDSSAVASSVLRANRSPRGANKSPQGDHQVPDSIASAEAQAMKEMEEIEGMLTIFEDGGPNPASGKVVGETADSKDGVNPEWVESVLGDINQIEGEQMSCSETPQRPRRQKCWLSNPIIALLVYRIFLKL